MIIWLLLLFMRLYENLTQKPLLFTYKSLRFFLEFEIEKYVRIQEINSFKNLLANFHFQSGLRSNYPQYNAA